MEDSIKYRCPCCHFKTLHEEHHYEICPVCFWEDDPYQCDNPAYKGGANSENLYEARENYLNFGAVSQRELLNVRSPFSEEY